MTDSAPRSIMPARLPKGPAERTQYSYGVRAGDFLYISGMVAFDEDANIVGEGDIEAQTEQVFQNLQAVVEEAGGFIHNIISTTTYLVDVTHAPVVNIARGRYFTGPVLPTHTVVGVAALARPQFLVEISAVAYLGK
ncbi:RidA family protein [Corynebacterium sp. S7]